MNASEMIVLAEEFSKAYTSGGSSSQQYDACGAWRNVVLRDAFAFKSVQNATDPDCVAEWDFYAMTTDEIRALISKPLYISKNGRTVVMERLQPLQWQDEDNEQYIATWKRLLRLIRATYKADLGDIKPSNFGKRSDGSVVMLDYGNIVFDLKEKNKDLTKQNYSKNIMAETMLA